MVLVGLHFGGRTRLDKTTQPCALFQVVPDIHFFHSATSSPLTASPLETSITTSHTKVSSSLHSSYVIIHKLSSRLLTGRHRTRDAALHVIIRQRPLAKRGQRTWAGASCSCTAQISQTGNHHLRPACSCSLISVLYFLGRCSSSAIMNPVRTLFQISLPLLQLPLHAPVQQGPQLRVCYGLRPCGSGLRRRY